MKKKITIVVLLLLLIISIIAGFFVYQKIHEPTPSEVLKAEGYISAIKKDIEIDQVSYQNKDRLDISSYEIGDKVKITYTKTEDINYLKSIKLIAKVEKESVVVDEIQTKLKAMTLDEKIGQMFIVDCSVENAEAAITNYHLGGIILFDANIKPYTRDQLISNLQSYQSAASIPLIVGIDEEGGTVNRLSWYLDYRSTPFSSPMDLFQSGGYEAIDSDTIEKATLLKSLGINVNFAPVADVPRSTSDYMYDRSFGLDPQVTSEYIRRIIKTMKEQQLGSVLKHFPGYGNNVNTHTGSAYDERAYSDFTSIDFLPFEAGINAGADAVLVNHNVMECIDSSKPSSLSAKVHRVLREELNFKGVIMTDDLKMEAIKQYANPEEVAIAAILAGNDILLSPDYAIQIESIKGAISNGTITLEQIDRSVYRILTWKKNIGILN